jgi:hypothetical protein
MELSVSENSGLPLPASFYCPITAEIMKDPVIATDGNTYERNAIVG